MTPDGALAAIIADAAAIVGPARRLRRRGEPDRSRLLAIGWATVDTDRAESELRTTLGLGGGSSVTLPRDPHLGAHCRRLPVETERPAILILEPDTEGRLAASLARLGEGPVAAWLAPGFDDRDLRARATAAGLNLSSLAHGPLGAQRLVLGGPAHGPHLLIAASGATMTA
jgi:hypothetical protein